MTTIRSALFLALPHFNICMTYYLISSEVISIVQLRGNNQHTKQSSLPAEIALLLKELSDDKVDLREIYILLSL